MSVQKQDYYAVLEIPQSADAAQIRRAYREQALLHHPDKNPDRLEEATERFKLIAEAYSVLSDTSARASYDSSSASADEEAQGRSSENVNFTDAKARDLFRDVFGEDIAHAVQKVTSGVIHTAHSFHSSTSAAASAAADRCGKVGVVRSAVAAGLSSRAQLAEEIVSDLRDDAERSKNFWQKRVKLLHEHEESVTATQQARQQRHRSVLERLHLKNNQKQVDEDAAFDRSAAQKMILLRKMVHDAAADWLARTQALEEAEAAALLVQEEIEDIQQNGASLGRAAQAGSLLFGRLKQNLCRSKDVQACGKPPRWKSNSDVRRSQSYRR